MLKAWPAVLPVVACALSDGYRMWRRGRGSPAKVRDLIWPALLLPVICLPALALPSVLGSSAMTGRDRVAAILATIATLPLVAALCFALALRVVRLYTARARSTAEARPKGPRW